MLMNYGIYYYSNVYSSQGAYKYKLIPIKISVTFYAEIKIRIL